jgi:hypothetical protein
MFSVLNISEFHTLSRGPYGTKLICLHSDLRCINFGFHRVYNNNVKG